MKDLLCKAVGMRYGYVGNHYDQICESTMKTLRMHAGCLLVKVLARYAVGVMGQRIVEIAFGKKTKKTKKKKRCRNEFLYGGFPAQRGFKIDLRKDIISPPTLPKQVEGE